MDQNSFPAEPSTVRPTTPVSPESVAPQKHYGRRLLITYIFAYTLPIIGAVILFSVLFSPPTSTTDGMVALAYMAILEVFALMFVGVLMLVFEVILLTMSIRYLTRGKLTGKVRIAAIIALVVYSVLTISLSGFVIVNYMI